MLLENITKATRVIQYYTTQPLGRILKQS